MKLSKLVSAALIGATMITIAPREAGAAVKIFGSITTDSNGAGSLTLPLLGSRWTRDTYLSFKTPFPVTLQVITTSTERVTAGYFGGPLIGIYTHTQKTIPLTTNSYEVVYNVYGVYPLYLPNRQYSYFYNQMASLEILSLPDTLINYSMTTHGLPEPSTWALMILGFGGIGAAMRRRASAGRGAARVSYSQ